MQNALRDLIIEGNAVRGNAKTCVMNKASFVRSHVKGSHRKKYEVLQKDDSFASKCIFSHPYQSRLDCSRSTSAVVGLMCERSHVGFVFSRIPIVDLGQKFLKC